MLSSSYSVKYKQLQRQQIQHFKDAKEVQKHAAETRSKKLQVETSKRRKQLAIKRKLEQAKEERRRQEILAKRREDINSATERYQRLNKNYTPKSDAEIKASLLTATRTPDLEDALQIVRGSPRPSSPNHGQQQYYRQGSGGTIRSSVKGHHMMYSPNTSLYNTSMYHATPETTHVQQQHQVTGSNRNLSQSNRSAPNQGTTSVNVTKHVQSSNTEKLHDHSLRNMVDSRSLFEQQLEQQQRNNAENNNKSLHQFSAALHKEVSGKENMKSPDLAIDRQSGSVTSMDSLEQASAFRSTSDGLSNGHTDYYSQKVSSPSDMTQTNSRLITSPSVYTNSNFGVHRSSNSPTVAVVQPSVVRRSPPETKHAVTANTDPRPYNKHNYDLKGTASSTGDHLQDSLEVTNTMPSHGNKGERSNLQNFLERYDYGQPLYPDGKDVYNGAAYQDITVGYTNGMDLSYVKPGYNSGGFNTSSQRSSGWAIPSTAEVSEIGKWNAPQSYGNDNHVSDSSLTITSKPLHYSQTQSGHTAESGYYLHTSTGQQASSMSGTNSYVSTSKPLKTNQQERPTENGHIYTSSHYTATNGTPAQIGNTVIYPTSVAGNHSIPHYPTVSSAYGPASTINGTTAGLPASSKVSDSHQVYLATGYNDSYTKASQQPSKEGYTNGNPHVTANGSYNASAYSASAASTPSMAHPAQVSLAVESKNAEISSSNTNNSNPVSEMNPAVVHGKNANYSTLSNTKKPPLPSAQNGAAKPLTTAKGLESTTVSNGTPNNAYKSASSVTTRPPSGIPRAVASTPPKATGATNDIDPSRIPRPKNPSFGSKPSLLDEEPSPTPSSQSEDEEANVEQDRTVFLEKKSIKGILKKPSSATLPRKTENFGVRGEPAGKASRSQRSMSAHARVAGPRDSVEVTREHNLKGKKRRKKKMVRFTDMTYTNDTETDTDEEEEVQEYNVYQNGDLHRPPVTTAKKPPTRPVSAKMSHQSKVDSSSGMKGVTSNGHRGQTSTHQPHPPSEPPSGRATMKLGQSPKVDSGSKQVNGSQQQPQKDSGASLNKGVVYSSGRDYTGVDRPAAHSGNTADKAQEAVYDANGVRLDRTPTDDEINWLWDKVRTCLNREGSTVSSTGGNGKKSEVNPYKSDANQYNNNPHGMRHSQQNTNNGKPLQQNGQHSMNTKYIDGNSLAPQFRAQTRISSAGGNHQPGVKKINMDALNSFSRRAGLLNQRKMKEQNATSITYNQGENMGSKAVIQTSVKPLGYQQPVQSAANPAHGGNQNGYHSDVSESMAAFLAAEQMAGQSVSESEIEAAMQEAQAKQASMNNNHRPSNKVPSAISIEEQHLLQSLERLNERLKATEKVTHPNVVHHGAFRGHVPLTNNNHPSKRFGSNMGAPSSSRGQNLRNSNTGAMYRPTTAMHYRTSNY